MSQSSLLSLSLFFFPPYNGVYSISSLSLCSSFKMITITVILLTDYYFHQYYYYYYCYHCLFTNSSLLLFEYMYLLSCVLLLLFCEPVLCDF